MDQRIEVRKWLVDQDDVGFVDERLCDHHFLLLTAREIGMQRLEFAPKAESVCPVVDPISDSVGLEIANVADELEVLTRRKKARWRATFGDDTDTPACFEWLDCRIGVEDANRSRIRLELASQRLECRCLPGTVWAEKAKHLATVDVKVHAVDRLYCAVGLAESVHPYDAHSATLINDR